MPHNRDSIAIVPVQAVLRAKPHESCAILDQAAHDALGKPLFDGDFREDDVTGLGGRFVSRNHEEQANQQNDSYLSAPWAL
jgi:hypothetical protein